MSLPAGGDAAVRSTGLAVVRLTKPVGPLTTTPSSKTNCLPYRVTRAFHREATPFLSKQYTSRVDDEPAGVPGVVVAIHPQAGGLIGQPV